MIYTSQRTLLSNAPRILKTLPQNLASNSGFPAPVLLRALAQPARTITATAHMKSHHPTTASCRAVNAPYVNTMIGSSFNRSMVSRHFSSSKSDTPEKPERTGQTLASTEKSSAPEAVIKISLANSVLVQQEPWSYSLYQSQGQYVLAVMCFNYFAEFEIGVLLNSEETLQALAGPRSLAVLADKIRNNTRLYETRRIIFED